MPPRCTHGAHGCSQSTWSALRAASEDGTGEPLTRTIEADVLPSEDTWEPERNIHDALIAEYDAAHPRPSASSAAASKAGEKKSN